MPSIYFELMATCLLNMKINGFVVHRSLMLARRGRLHFHTEKQFLHRSLIRLKELTNCYNQDFYIHLMPLASFYTPWKHYKTKDFIMFSAGTEKNHWHEIGSPNKFLKSIHLLSSPTFEKHLPFKKHLTQTGR